MQTNNKINSKMDETNDTSPAFQHAIIPTGSDRRSRNLVLPKRFHGGAKVASEPMQQYQSFINGGYDSLPDLASLMSYPIERTSTSVSSRDPSLIASRVLACLQRLSITAKCNARESEVRVQKFSRYCLLYCLP